MSQVIINVLVQQFFLRRPTLRPTLDPSQTVVLNHGHGYSNKCIISAEGVLFTHG